MTVVTALPGRPVFWFLNLQNQALKVRFAEAFRGWPGATGFRVMQRTHAAWALRCESSEQRLANTLWWLSLCLSCGRLMLEQGYLGFWLRGVIRFGLRSHQSFPRKSSWQQRKPS